MVRCKLATRVRAAESGAGAKTRLAEESAVGLKSRVVVVSLFLIRHADRKA